MVYTEKKNIRGVKKHSETKKKSINAPDTHTHTQREGEPVRSREAWEMRAAGG